VEQSIGEKMILTVNYNGMHGVHLPLADFGINAYCPPNVAGSPCPNGFAGLPASAPNPAFGAVYQYTNAGISNYNGLTISLQRRLSAGLTFNLNYTWSHNLDDVSNGGIENENYSLIATDASVTVPQNPRNLSSNYGNSDYDVRHYLSANFVLSDMFRHTGFNWGPNPVFGGWTLSSNWFLRSGLPYSVIDGAADGALGAFNYTNATILASPVGYIPTSCTNGPNTPCLSTSQFAPGFATTGVINGFGTMGRNQLYGPHFFNVDLALMKSIRIKERLTFSFGASASNLFNHPNFDNPVNNLANPSQFGQVINTVSPPTSILGSFLGAGGSPRFVEIKGVLRF
jgi:hypothetical protein